MMGMMVVVVMWGLTAYCSCELEKVHRNRRPGATFLQILLKALNSHVVCTSVYKREMREPYIEKINYLAKVSGVVSAN